MRSSALGGGSGRISWAVAPSAAEPASNVRRVIAAPLPGSISFRWLQHSAESFHLSEDLGKRKRNVRILGAQDAVLRLAHAVCSMRVRLSGTWIDHPNVT